MSDDINDTVEFTEDPNIEDQTGEVKPNQISEAVLFGTDWTTETILSQLLKGNIDLNPRFQRRDAWRLPKKRKFIESLILGLPIPPIVLAEKKRQKGKFVVLDGKQRLLTLLQFTGNAEGSRNNGFDLGNLEIREGLNKVTFEELKNASQYADDFDALFNQTIRTIVIRNWPNEAFLHIVFTRLNTSSSPLAPQELRQALFPGEFVTYIDDRAFGSEVLKNLLKLKEPDFRMRDVEMMIRFLSFSYFINDYAGNMSLFLDKTCEKLNLEWEQKEEEIEEQVKIIEGSLEAAMSIFDEKYVGRKWLPEDDKFQSRLNRAVLDVIVFYFSNNEIREKALEESVAVVEAFKNLCSNEEFRVSIETTTKSISATYIRLNLWGNALNEVLGLDFRVPIFNEDNNRIEFDGFFN